MKQIVLKPCPFCGEKPWLGKWPLALDKSPDDYQCSIECENPECGAAIISSCFEEASIQETQWKMEVIKRWNNRYESTAYASLADAIQKDIEYAWGWHCNIAGNIEHEGIEPIKANKIAARLMELMFGVDTTKHVAYPTGDKEFQEPVDEHLRSVQKRKDTVWDAVRLAYHEYDGGGIKGTRAEYIGNKALKAFNDSPTSDTKPSVESPESYCCPNKCEKKPDHLVDTNKMVEKEALKLRVGGVYKNRKGEIKKITNFIPDRYWPYFTDQDGFFYFEDGAFLFDKQECDSDLIEEAQIDVREDTTRKKCGHSYFMSEVNCKACKEHRAALDRKFDAKKTEGNPFKVGDFALVYGWPSPYSCYVKGKVTEINDDNTIIIETNAEKPCDLVRVHYKQCERVNEEN